MKLAVHSYPIGIAMVVAAAVHGPWLDASESRAGIESDSGVRYSEVLRIDRHSGFEIIVDHELGSTALWQGAVVDIDGDGIDDLIIGLPMASPEGRTEAGLVAVIYGRVDGFTSELRLSDLEPDQGFLIPGGQPGERLGWSLANIGDFNGNGLDDLAIGAPGRQRDNGRGAGSVYVLFGQAAFPANVDATLFDGERGIRVDGAGYSEALGYAVAGIGDFNGNGLADFAIGDPDASPGGIHRAGSVDIVYGSSTAWPAVVELGRMNADLGLRMTGSAALQFFGFSLSATGDFSGNGFNDLLIGAPGASTAGPVDDAGAAFLVFGGRHRFSAPVTAGFLVAEHAIEMTAGIAGDHFGLAVASSAIRDNRIQLIIGSPMADAGELTGAGAVYLIGNEQPLNAGVEFIGSDASLSVVRVQGSKSGSGLGWMAGQLGDISNDGRPDLVFGGIPEADRNPGRISGRRYTLVPGSLLDRASDTEAPEHNALRSLEFSIDARTLTGHQGTGNWTIAGAGSLDQSGRTFVVFGDGSGSTVADQPAKLHVYPARIGSDRIAINLGQGIPNQVVTSGEDLEIAFTVDGDDGNPDDFIYQVAESVIAGGGPNFEFDFGGAGENRTLTLLSQPGALGLSVITLTVTDPDTGTSVQSSFAVGLRNEFAPVISTMTDVRTYDSRDVMVPFTIGVHNFVIGDSSNEKVVIGSLVEVDVVGEDGTVSIFAPDTNPGQTVIWVFSAIVNGSDQDAYSGFQLQVFADQPPFINDSEGLPGPQSVMETQSIAIQFTVGDLVDPPEVLEVDAFELAGALDPGQFAVGCDGENCVLDIETELGMSGPDPYGIGVEVLNTISGLAAIAEFDLMIVERPAPEINGGVPIPDQAVIAGQSIDVEFTVDDPIDDPELLEVVALTGDPELLPQSGLALATPCPNGDCTLSIEAPELSSGPVQVTIEVTSSVGLTASETFELNIGLPDPPVINEGEPLANQEITEGQSGIVVFTVTEPVATASLEVTAESGNQGVIADGDLAVSAVGPDLYELNIATTTGSIGSSDITVSASNTGGITTSTFTVTVLERPAPEINGGVPIPNETASAGELLVKQFSVSDQFDPPELIMVTVTTGDEQLLPQGAIDLGLPCSVGECVLNIAVPADSAGGSVAITVEAINSAGRSASAMFVLAIEAAPLPPLINNGAGIANQSVVAGQSLNIAFAVVDPNDPPQPVVVSAQSNNPAILPDSAISISGSGVLRTISILTSAGQSGAVSISVEAVNQSGLTADGSFTLFIQERAAPVIGGIEEIDNQQVVAGRVLEVPFTVSDDFDSPGSITAIAHSDNPDLLPDDAISIVNLGSERLLVIETVPGQIGIVTITITATNSGGLQEQTSFELIVVDEPAELGVAAQRIDVPAVEDVYIRLDISNIGDTSAYQVVVDIHAADGYELAGGYSLAPECDIDDGGVYCDPDQIEHWSCHVNGEELHCDREALHPQVVAPVVVHLRGTGESEMMAIAAARNSEPVSLQHIIDN